MRDQMEQRLRQLREEFQSGEKQAVQLESRLTDLRATLQRISGAIKVLEELLAESGPSPSGLK
jgi:prefoldin subunit 5